MTKVVHINQEPFDIRIDRLSKWGNPYSHKDGTLAKFKVKTRAEAISKYREYILSNPELLNDLHELENKILGCWCKDINNPKSCHGDILIELLKQKNNLESILG